MKVIVRTVTHYYVGEIVEKDPGLPEIDNALFPTLALTKCSWIADTGRWHQALATGSLNEVEPYPAGDVVYVSLGAVVDIAPWNHELPTAAK